MDLLRKSQINKKNIVSIRDATIIGFIINSDKIPTVRLLEYYTPVDPGLNRISQ